jgi:hypothetical protein
VASFSSQSSAPSVDVESFGPAYVKYTRMRKSGLPDGAVLNAMNRDGVAIPPEFFGASFEAAPAHAPLKLAKSAAPRVSIE